MAKLTEGGSADKSHEQSGKTKGGRHSQLGLTSGILVRKDSSCRNSDGVCHKIMTFHKIMKHCGTCGSYNLSAKEALMFIDFLLEEAESSIWVASIESSQVSGRSLNEKKIRALYIGVILNHRNCYSDIIGLTYSDI